MANLLGTRAFNLLLIFFHLLAGDYFSSPFTLANRSNNQNKRLASERIESLFGLESLPRDDFSSSDGIRDDLERLLNKRHLVTSALNGKKELELGSGKKVSRKTGAGSGKGSLLLENSRQQPPNELVFSNSTGAIAFCGVATELAKSIERVEQLMNIDKFQRAQDHLSPEANTEGRPGKLFYQQQQQQTADLLKQFDIQIKWEQENGAELEPTVFASQAGNELQLPLDQQQRRLNPSGPQRPLRCRASSSTRGASLISRDMRVKAYAASATGTSATNANLDQVVSVSDETVLIGNTATFKCSIPFWGQDYLQVLDWLEYPNESMLNFHSSTMQNLIQLFPPLLNDDLRNFSQAASYSSNDNNNQLANDFSSKDNGRLNSTRFRYFVAPKTGDLHILNADLNLNSKSYKCRCKNKLTGEIVESANRGKLIVLESASLLGPKLVKLEQPKQLTFNEGELAILNCNLQAQTRGAQVTWFRTRRRPAPNYAYAPEERLMDDELIEISAGKQSPSGETFAQLASLLFIGQLSRNHSGSYVCQLRNGDERFEVDLFVKAPLRAKLTASANVLELGKSLSLECSVTGFPIHQVVFRHNQNIIKSISGQVAEPGADNYRFQHTLHHYSNQREQAAAGSGTGWPGARSRQAAEGSYFVVDNGLGESGPSLDQRQADETRRLAAASSPAGSEANSIIDDNLVAVKTGGASSIAIATGTATTTAAISSSAIDAAPNESPKIAGDPTTNRAGADEELEEDFERENEIKLSHVVVIVLEPQHAGSYQCFAYNQFESTQSGAYIKVLDDPPKFKSTFKEEVHEQRQDISLQCSARANPLPEITWSLDGQPIPADSPNRVRFGDFVTKDNLLISYVNISQAQVIDSGLYKCTADNGLASVSHQAQVSVRGPVQVKPMANMTLVAATNFRQRCPVAGYPVQEIQWQHNGRRLPANHRQHVYENGTLEVEHVEKSQDDEGEYVCIAKGPNGPDGQPAKLAFGSLFVSIKVRPSIEPFTISRALREGQRATIMCTISSGDLPISISWFRNGQPLVLLNDLSANKPQVVQQLKQQQQPHQPLQRAQSNELGPELDLDATGSAANYVPLANVKISRPSDYSSTLMFESLLVEHSGNYSCSAKNDAGSVSHQAAMIVQVAPKWSIEPSDTNIVRGTASTIDCMASGFPPPRIIWTKASGNLDSYQQQRQYPDNAQLKPPPSQQQQQQQQLGSWRSIVSSPHLQVYENGSLNILDARDSDSGYYMCQASNGVGSGLSKVIRVIINVAAQFNNRHSIQYAVKGEQAQLKCSAKGDWPIVIHWFKNKNRLQQINLQDQDHEQGLLASTVGSLAPARAHPPGPQQTVSSTLASVLLIPGSTLPPSLASSLVILKGQSVLDQLNSLLSQTTKASTQLQQQQQQQAQQQSQAGLLLQKYSLSTTDIVLRDQHNYNQVASEGAGYAPSGSQLANLAPLLGQVNSMLTINQVDRQDTALFKCLAANHFGFDERTIQLIVQELPDKIDDFSALEIGSRSVTLAWLLRFDGNAPIQNYHIQYKAVQQQVDGRNQLAHQEMNANQMSSETLSGLNWLNYSLSVQSLLSSDQQQPQQPQQPQPHLNNQNSDQFVLSAGSAGSRSPLKIALNQLKPMTRYWFRIIAENKLGLGPASNVLEALTKEEAPGFAPSKIKVSAQSSSTILVSWSRIDEKEMVGSVSGYHIAYRPFNLDSNNTSGSSNEPQATQTPQTNIYKTILDDGKLSKFEALLGGLKRSTKYVISIQAYNSIGTGPASEPIVVRTLEMDPPRQVKLFLKQATNCSIQLEWRPQSQAALLLLQAKSAPNASVNPQSQIYHPSESQSGSMNDSLPRRAQILLDSADSVDYYSLYQAEVGEQHPLRWQETRLVGHASSHQVENLRCGTRYQFYMTGVNRVGVGDKSDIFETKTAGGLPISPDRQLITDVLNVTCYLIRLDHWQDNGCPIREFNIRYRLESATSSWIQLAHFNLDEISENFDHLASSSAKEKQFNIQDENFPQRMRRSTFASDEDDDVYVFPAENSNRPSGSGLDDDDAFLDYSLNEPLSLASNSNDYFIADNLNVSALRAEAQLFDSKAAQPERGQLFSLLKDSMLPTLIDSSELIESPRVGQPEQERKQQARQQLRLVDSLPPFAQEWQSSNFMQNSNLDSNPRLLQQQQLEKRIIAGLNHQESDSWQKVKLCGLNENQFYVIQITALNSVGETEAELRILTSQAGLEYNENFKRQVVGKLANQGLFGTQNRLAQSITFGERLNLFSLSQSPVLLPITLTLISMTIIIIVAMLLKKSHNQQATTTTTTTTTLTSGAGSAFSQSGGGTTASSSINATSNSTASSASSGSQAHCQNYLNESHANHHHSQHHLLHPNSTSRFHLGLGFKSSGPASAITEAATIGSDNLTIATRQLNENRYVLASDETQSELNMMASDNYHLSHMNIYQQQQQQQQQLSFPEEPAYGIVGFLGPDNGKASETTGSPKTTATNSSSSSGNNNLLYGHYNGSQQQQMFQPEVGPKGRNVFLCSKDEQPKSEAAIAAASFYGLANSNNNTVLQYKQDQQQLQQAQSVFQQQEQLYASSNANRAMMNLAAPSDGKLENRFMSIIEEVASANANLQRVANHGAKLTNSKSQENNKLQILDQAIALAAEAQCNGTDSNTGNNANNMDSLNGQHQANLSYLLENEQLQEASQRLMFDPVYATIQRTFPQAFRYLTLQQNQHQRNQFQANSNCTLQRLPNGTGQLVDVCQQIRQPANADESNNNDEQFNEQFASNN